MKLYMRARGDTWEDCNEALRMQRLSFRVGNHGNHTTLCRWLFDVKEGGWYWETGGRQMSDFLKASQVRFKIRTPPFMFCFTLHHRDAQPFPPHESVLCCV